MPGVAESLNVAAAVAVCLFEQVRQRLADESEPFFIFLVPFLFFALAGCCYALADLGLLNWWCPKPVCTGWVLEFAMGRTVLAISPWG